MTDPKLSQALNQAKEIAASFDIASPIEVADFPRKGNINQHTYWIKAGPPAGRAEYLLQLLNPGVFTQPGRVMDAMIACLQSQEAALAEDAAGNAHGWETMRLVPTLTHQPYLEVHNGSGLKCWRMMTFIPETHSYKSLREIPDSETRLLIAEEAGRGLALFSALTARMDPSRIHCPLPGYRDTELYYRQFASVLAGHQTPEEAEAYLPQEETLRRSTEPHFHLHLSMDEHQRRLADPHIDRTVALALEQKSCALTLAQGLASGKLKRSAIHGDTKLENFLFCDGTEKVKSLVDLDTIMPHTWLSDWGDMIRSLTNIAGEKESDLDAVQIDLAVFEAAAKGYLSAAHPNALQEAALMADAPQILALELGVRFLTDYLRGDNYFTVGPQDPPDLNKTRALVQFRVFEELRRHAGFMRSCITQLLKK